MESDSRLWNLIKQVKATGDNTTSMPGKGSHELSCRVEASDTTALQRTVVEKNAEIAVLQKKLEAKEDLCREAEAMIQKLMGERPASSRMNIASAVPSTR